MATGLTHALETMNYDVPRWLKETIIRSMGVCITLRDESYGLSEKQIKDALAKERDDEIKRNQSSYDSAVKEFDTLRKRTNAEWKTFYAKARVEAQKDYEKRLKEHNEKHAAHEKALDHVNTLLAKAVRAHEGDVVVNTLKLAKQQLEDTIKHDYTDYQPYKDSCLTHTVNKWSAGQIQSAKNSVEWRKEDLEKSKARVVDRVDSYISFIKFVNEATQ